MRRSRLRRSDLNVGRLDKIMFREVAVHFEAGLKENDLTPARIADEVSNFHVPYVVVQTGYMSYYPAVQVLEAAIHRDKFTEIRHRNVVELFFLPISVS